MTEKAADLTVVLKTPIDSLHTGDEPQKVIAKNAGFTETYSWKVDRRGKTRQEKEPKQQG